jgi:hypothetical protein
MWSTDPERDFDCQLGSLCENDANTIATGNQMTAMIQVVSGRGVRTPMKAYCRKSASWTLGLALLCFQQMEAADTPVKLAARAATGQVNSSAPIFSCGGGILTASEVLNGRYPDPDALTGPETFKQQSRAMVEKWRQEDLTNWQSLAAQACADMSQSPERWTLENESRRLERESHLFELRCACSTAILAQATNRPPAPTGLKIVTETGIAAQSATETRAATPVRLSHAVQAKRTAWALNFNAAEIMAALSGKPASGTGPRMFETEVSGEWNNEYKKALEAIALETARVEALSAELDRAGVPSNPRAAHLTATELPQSRAKLQEQAALLSVAYDGIVKEQELPRGECYEVFAIRHQLLLQGVDQLTAAEKLTTSK